MTDIGAELLTYLKTVGAITSLVGSGTSAKIWPDLIKELDSPYPCLVYRRAGGGPMTGIGGRLGLSRARFEITAFALTRAGADALDLVTYDAMQGGNKTMGTTVVTEVYVDPEGRDSGADYAGDGSDQATYWARTSYVIWYADDDG